jgi:hypothetical protein
MQALDKRHLSVIRAMPGHPLGVNRASFLRIGPAAAKANFIGISAASNQTLTKERRT